MTGAHAYPALLAGLLATQAAVAQPVVPASAPAVADSAAPDFSVTARLAAARASLTSGDAESARRLLAGLPGTLTPPQTAELARIGAGLEALREARALRGLPPDPTDPDSQQHVSMALRVPGPEDVQPPTQAAPSLAPPAGSLVAPSLASPPELNGQDTYARETDEDGDQVFVRRRMLDTDVTELPPPTRNGSGPPPSPVIVDMRPPVPVITATSVGSQDVGPAGTPPEPATDTATRVNPFAGESPADIPVTADPAAPAILADLAAPATTTDPMTARIDQDIAAQTSEPAPSIVVASGFRGRSGTAGTSQLAEVTVPLQASFSAGGGLIGLAVTPDFLGAGSLAQNAPSLSQFGTLALGRHESVSISTQNAYGTGLDVSYRTSEFSADVGATPLGFQQQNVVGGVEWAPTLDDGVRLRLDGERRAVTDSLLSYAGTTDPQSGAKWGGVTYDRGHANLELTGALTKVYIGVGGGFLDGQNVKSNTEIEAGAGGSTRIWSDLGQELRLGVDLVYYGFANNLGGFTLGQGGYFSPQTYFAALVPLTFKDQPSSNLSYEIGGTAGVQTYHENSSATFPNNTALQSALVAQQANPATSVDGVATTFSGQNATGFSGGAHGLIDYRVTSGFHLGGKLDYEHIGDFNQFVGLLYGRYVFGGPSGH